MPIKSIASDIKIYICPFFPTGFPVYLNILATMSSDPPPTFITSLSQFLQSKAHFQFDEEFQLIGHIHVQIDRHKTLDYVLNEFVDRDLLKVASKSFQALPTQTLSHLNHNLTRRNELLDLENTEKQSQIKTKECQVVKRNDSISKGQTAVRFAPGSLVSKQVEAQSNSTGSTAANDSSLRIASFSALNPHESENEESGGDSQDDADLESQLNVSFQQEDYTIEVNKENEASDEEHREDPVPVRQSSPVRQQPAAAENGLLPVKEEVVPAWLFDDAYQGAYVPGGYCFFFVFFYVFHVMISAIASLDILDLL